MNLTFFLISVICSIPKIADSGSTFKKRPNIIFILADDLGFNDVPWHNDEVKAPSLMKLAQEGVILEQSYVQPICTPTRSALLTGVYPFSLGRQRGVLRPKWPTGLTLKSKLIPEYLKPLGYSTHAIGKWHLGFCNWSYTPTERGFDSFRGFYTGAEDYYWKTRYDIKWEDMLSQKSYSEEILEKKVVGYDYRNNKDVYFQASNVYSTYGFANYFKEIVQSRNKSSPFFIYMAFQSVHAPQQVPDQYLKPYLHIKNWNRRMHLAMVSAMDDAIGNMLKALKDSGAYENSAIIFSTDVS